MVERHGRRLPAVAGADEGVAEGGGTVKLRCPTCGTGGELPLDDKVIAAEKVIAVIMGCPGECGGRIIGRVVRQASAQTVAA
jgi:hypothetical protein